MNQRIHFISGLPRSGSTLLSALLRQNPRFEAGISSPLASMCSALLGVWATNSEFAYSFTEEQKLELLRGLFQNYYRSRPDDRVIFDTNRAWCARLGLLTTLFDEVKMVCCVRNVAWVLDSFERLVQRYPLVQSRLFNDENERGTVYSRVEALARPNRVVGYALAALREAYYGEHSSHLLLVDYELLARYPLKCLKLIYQFLGEEPFAHDPEQVAFAQDEFDRHLGLPDLHRVSDRVEFRERRTVLPPDLFARYQKNRFWNDPTGTQAGVIALPREQGS